jgi:FkbM family methyltransferase
MAHSFLKRLVPRKMLTLARSFQSAIRLGIVPTWLSTLRNGHSSIRLGSEYGGWTLPDGCLDSSSVCYCVGCGEDISFDLELLARYACVAYGFDPTPRSIEFVREATQGINAYHFLPVGLWSSDGTVRFYAPPNENHVSHSITNLTGGDTFIEVPTRRLKGLMLELGHPRLNLLKLDIEGAENEVIRALLDDGVCVDVLLVEFDELGFPTPERITRMQSTLRELFRSGYRLFNLTGTNLTFVSSKREQPC